jgi:hypothetical protein
VVKVSCTVFRIVCLLNIFGLLSDLTILTSIWEILWLPSLDKACLAQIIIYSLLLFGGFGALKSHFVWGMK